VPDAARSHIETRAARELDQLRDQAQLRSLESLSGIDLCSNDYLGLATDPRLKQAVADAVANANAVGSTGSRLLSGNTPEWEALESEFAAFALTDAALYFGSG
jgi:8-amino-7-oxononanoate synthase